MEKNGAKTANPKIARMGKKASTSSNPMLTSELMVVDDDDAKSVPSKLSKFKNPMFSSAMFSSGGGTKHGTSGSVVSNGRQKLRRRQCLCAVVILAAFLAYWIMLLYWHATTHVAGCTSYCGDEDGSS